MGLLRSALLAAVLLLGSAGCRHRYQLRIDTPAGATMEVQGGPFARPRSLPIPFIATFEPADGYAYYPVTIDLAGAVSDRYGGGGKTVRLYGKLYVHAATPLTRGTTVRLPIPDARIAALVSGQLAEITHYVYDPSRPGGEHLALVVFRTRPF